MKFKLEKFDITPDVLDSLKNEDLSVNILEVIDKDTEFERFIIEIDINTEEDIWNIWRSGHMCGIEFAVNYGITKIENNDTKRI